LASQDLDLEKPQFQSQLRSKPVRNALTDIENNFNSLRAEVYASIASTASEVTSARDNFSALDDNIHERKVFTNVINGTASYMVSNVSGLQVQIAAGSGIVDGVGVYHNTTATASVTSPAASNNRIDYVIINTDNTQTIVTGTETTGTAVDPSIASTQMEVAKWKIYDTTGTVAITDLRLDKIKPYLNEEFYNATFSYTGETMSSFSLINQQNQPRQYDVNYSGATIASLGITIDGVRYKTEYTYSGETLTEYKQSIGG
jgi:hypothetical protein